MSAPESALEPLDAGLLDAVLLDERPLRLSVTYQPLPLKTTGGTLGTRLAMPLPHFSQVCVDSAEKLWTSS